MRVLKFIYLGLGLALLYLVVSQVDLADVRRHVLQTGWGFAVILGIYFAAFAIDSFTWLMALTRLPMNLLWSCRTWALRMIGEAFNYVIPAAGMGGEPVKAAMLKRHYGVTYKEGTASIILARTINMVALCTFLIVGFVFMLGHASLDSPMKLVAGIGLAALLFGTGGLWAVQRFRVTSLAGTRLSRWPLATRLESVLHHIYDMDERLVSFYRSYRGRFFWAVVLALINWILGAVEIYYMTRILERPVTWEEAWIIEAVAQMVRTGTFFIPASIGAQEGAFLLVCGAMTGSPALGVAVAVVRRAREIIWILWGFALGGWYLLTRGPLVDAEPE